MWPIVEGLVAAVQLRTRLIDVPLLKFIETGGRQVLILGAGFDARALRLKAALGDTVVFEVDHPATQARKQALLPESTAVYVPWDFERQPVDGLPEALARVGHDPSKPTLTVWEGVTLYLTPDAIDASMRAMRVLSGPGSALVFTYMDRTLLRRGWARRLAAAIIAFGGEPLRFGLVPEQLTQWLHERGAQLVQDACGADAAEALLPKYYAQMVTDRCPHIAYATWLPRLEPTSDLREQSR